MSDDKKYKVDWTMHDCVVTTIDDYTYTSKYNDWSDITISGDFETSDLSNGNQFGQVFIDGQLVNTNGQSPQDLFDDWKDEELRQKYPALQHAWEEYRKLLEQYKVWDHVATDKPVDDKDILF